MVHKKQVIEEFHKRGKRITQQRLVILDILSEKEWELLELCVVFGYKRVEAAKLLGAPVSTVNWQYNNILKKLGKSFKEVYDVRD